ncbi:MAG: methyltransferase domain-containing protein [Planctomycetia bacterium]|nr:methyltransferase domain-containing protein [Planctomycetia bacterium]
MSATLPAVNYWPQSSCAKAFWGQHELPPYQQLLHDTVSWLDVQPGQRWLDLGCGGGQLTRALWRVSEGELGEIVGSDCAAANAHAYEKLRARLEPVPGDRINFVTSNFSDGLPFAEDDSFDGVVSGLAIQYAESFCAETGRWDTAAYERVLAEVWRVLKPGGQFAFSVNIPEPSWVKVAALSVFGFFAARRPVRYLQKAYAMWRYGGWLKVQARQGRFHYLPRPLVVQKLLAAGFVQIERRRSFAGQAYLFRCRKPE